MCLINVKGPFVAEEDIICFKYFKETDEGLMSPFRDYIWNSEGEKAAIWPKFDEKGDLIILEGLHAFTTKASCELDIDTWMYYKKFVIKKMVIPKYTAYYTGMFEEFEAIAAEKMIFAKELE